MAALVTAQPGTDRIILSKYQAGHPDKRKEVSTRVADVIRTAVEFGASYPDIAQLLLQAAKQQNLSGRIEIDALPGEKFTGAISRIADSEDTQTRLMRVEIDLPNPKDRIHQGMFGRTTILLDRVKTPSIFSSCLVGKTNEGKGSVYVVRDGHVHLTPVDIGQDNGVRVGILRGLTGKEQVVRRPPNNLGDSRYILQHLANPHQIFGQRHALRHATGPPFEIAQPTQMFAQF